MAHLQLLLYLCCFVHTFSSLTHFWFEVSKARLSKPSPFARSFPLRAGAGNLAQREPAELHISCGMGGIALLEPPRDPQPGGLTLQVLESGWIWLGCVWERVLPLESFSCKFFSGLSPFMMLFQGSGYCCCCFGNECHCLSSATGNAPSPAVSTKV